jgi:hypothetical protein
MKPWGNALADILSFVQTDAFFKKAAISVLVVLISMFMIYLCQKLKKVSKYETPKFLIDFAAVLIFVQAVFIVSTIYFESCPLCWLGFTH